MKNIEYKVSGKVIHGDHFGKQLGFPTANLDRRDYTRRNLKIKFGVWAGAAELASGKKYKAAIVIGPLDKKKLPKIEAHLLNFKGNLYGKKLNIYLNKYLRPFEKYHNVDILKKQIAKDIKQVKQLTINT